MLKLTYIGLLLLQALAQTHAGPGVVRLNPQLNTIFAYQMDMNMAMTGAPGADKSIDMNVTQSWKFTKKTDKGFHAIFKMEDVSGSAELGDALSKLKGTSEDVEIDSRGKVLSAKSSSGDQAAQIMGSLTGLNTGFMGVLLPEAAPQEGLSWTEDMNLADAVFSGSDSHIKVNYRISKIEDHYMWVESTADKTLTLNPEGGPGMTLGMSIETYTKVNMLDGMVEHEKLKTKTKMMGTPMGDVEMNLTGTISLKSSK